MTPLPNTKKPISLPPFKSRRYTSQTSYDCATRESRWINLYPGDTHKKYGEIIDAWDAGIKVRITRVKRVPSSGGHTPSLGDILFVPWGKCGFAYCSQEEAEDTSVLGYGKGQVFNWQEFCEEHDVQ